MQKLEFMSPEWIATAQKVITSALAEKDLNGIDYTPCEEFTNPPKHLLRPGAETIGFYVRVADKKVEVGDHPIETADFRIVSDYQDALPVARDPDAAAADPAVIQERLAAGRLKIFGNPMDAPPVFGEVDIHRMLAPQTA
ncbi:MAG: hypothetical protein AB7P33_12465 [Dehalococcoidia bacterium]